MLGGTQIYHARSVDTPPHAQGIGPCWVAREEGFRKNPDTPKAGEVV